MTLAKQIEELAGKATPGPWEIDTEYDSDERCKNYFIGAPVPNGTEYGRWATLFDSVNSDHKLIEEDYDEDGGSAWDETARCNAELIVALVNNLPTIIAALKERDRPQAAAVITETVDGDSYSVSTFFEAQSAWQTINTAPKDRSILLARFGWSIIDLKADWDDPENKEWRLFWAVRGHWSERFNNWNDGVEPSGLASPSHWLDLPQDALPNIGPNGCTVPPEGWWCSRQAGHNGPCAARAALKETNNAG